MNQKTHFTILSNGKSVLGRSLRLFTISLSFSSILLCLTLSSCGGKKEVKTVEQIEREQIQQDREEKREVIRLANTEAKDSVRYNGHRYEYKIARVSDDSLGIVTDAEGYRTVDNAITLTVKRDGGQVLSKRYTRRAFKIGISDEDFSQYVLMNMVYDRMTTSGMRFAVSLGVGSADDMFVQFALTVGDDGSTNITPLEFFDEEDIRRFDDEP